MSSLQISKYVLPAKEIREAKALDDQLQRDLKPRTAKIVSYLKTRETRFFNAILLGVFDSAPNWVEFDLSAVAGKLNFESLDVAKSSMGLLTFSGQEKIFAIDGQHRVEAIREAHKKFPDGVGDDQYAVIFLSHDDSKEGKVRTRRLFCDINKNAVAVSQGDRVIIDEDEVTAIATRRVYAEYPYFNDGKEVAVTEKVEWVAKDGREYFTSLLAVYTVSKKLKRLFRKPRGSQESAPENVTALQSIMTAFFDFIIVREPSLRRYFIDKKTTPAKERKANRSLAFRPIGMELLARLYVHFAQSGRLPVLAWALENLVWTSPGGVWDGTVWLREKIQPKAKSAAIDYVLYLLHELADSEIDSLTASLREYRNDEAFELPPRSKLPAKLEKQALR